ncbi:MAG: PDZ domain-containing protein, partial [Planctomycetaceae bacterium]
RRIIGPRSPAFSAGPSGTSVMIRRTRRGIFTFESRDVATADVIVGVNGRKTVKPDEFLSEVESHRPGDRITIEVIRGGEVVSVPVVLE